MLDIAKPLVTPKNVQIEPSTRAISEATKPEATLDMPGQP